MADALKKFYESGDDPGDSNYSEWYSYCEVLKVTSAKRITELRIGRGVSVEDAMWQDESVFSLEDMWVVHRKILSSLGHEFAEYGSEQKPRRNNFLCVRGDAT